MADYDFLTFMREVVLPSKAAQPDAIDLNGSSGRDNRHKTGVFWHNGKR